MNFYVERVFKEHYKKNAVVSLSFIIICLITFSYIHATIGNINSQDEFRQFLAPFGVTAQSLEFPSSFLMMHFTHLSLLHIIPNCFFFFLICRALSFAIHWKQLLALCLTAIVTTSVFSYFHILITDSQETPTIVIGFSGVAFATLGALFYYMEKNVQIQNALFLGTFHVVFFMIDGVNIAWYTHLYGFLTGLAFAFNIKFTNIEHNRKRAYELAIEDFKRMTQNNEGLVVDNESQNIIDKQ